MKGKGNLTLGYESASRGTKPRYAVLATRWYEDIIGGLLDGALETLKESGVPDDNIEEFRVPGAFEMPLAAKKVADTHRFDGIVSLGAVVRGETPHFDYIAGEAAYGLASVARQTGIPIGFGILTCDTIEQAQARSKPGPDNKGAEAARAVIEMVGFIAEL